MPTPQEQADAWNAAHPEIGVPVLYRKDHGSLTRTATRSPAEVLSGHTAVIWLEGVRGCVALDRVTHATISGHEDVAWEIIKKNNVPGVLFGLIVEALQNAFDLGFRAAGGTITPPERLRPRGFDCNNTSSPGGRDPSPF